MQMILLGQDGTCNGSTDAVQVSDVGVGGVGLEEVLLHLTVAVVAEVQREGGGGEQREEEEEERWHLCSAICREKDQITATKG